MVDAKVTAEFLVTGETRHNARSGFFRDGMLCGAVSYGRPGYVMQALPELLRDPGVARA